MRQHVSAAAPREGNRGPSRGELSGGSGRHRSGAGRNSTRARGGADAEARRRARARAEAPPRGPPTRSTDLFPSQAGVTQSLAVYQTNVTSRNYDIGSGNGSGSTTVT